MNSHLIHRNRAFGGPTESSRERFRLEEYGHLGSILNGHQRPAWSCLPVATLWIWLFLFAVELLVSIYLCDGRLIFTLDDPYIHLAVADSIRSGGYGVNLAEMSSPSSSIIWPYLLAVTETLQFGATGPLLINGAAAAAAVWAFMRVLERAGLFEPSDMLVRMGGAVLAIFATSAIVLPMTGLEHSLHVWASIITFAGLLEAAQGKSPTFVHFVALVSLALLRFEGVAFAAVSIAAFAWLGQRRFAGWAAIALAVLLGTYFTSMALRGLPLVPSAPSR